MWPPLSVARKIWQMRDFTVLYQKINFSILFFVGLWGLVNNAGVNTAVGPLQLQLNKHMKRTFDVNFFGLVNVTKAFLRLIKKSKGRIVNMSSGNGLMATSPNWPYVATKFAVEAFTDSIRYAFTCPVYCTILKYHNHLSTRYIFTL